MTPGPAAFPTYRRFAGNATAALAGRAAAIALALVLSTALFRTLGPVSYGIWAFCYALVGYQALFDLGLGATVERLVARAYWASDSGAIERVLNHAAACAMFIAGGLLVAALAIPVQEIRGIDVRGLRVVLPLLVLLSLLASVTGAGLSGVQRLGRLNLLRVAMNAASTLLVLALVLGGVRRLEWLLLGYSLGLAGASLLAWVSLQQVTGRLAVAPSLADRRLLAEFARFGGAVQIASFGPQLADQLFRIVLGLRFGAAWIGYYDLGSRAAIVLRSLAGTLLVPMVPFGVQQHLEGGPAALAGLFRVTLKYTALWLLPATALALYHSPLLIRVWLGDTAGTWEVLLVFQVFLAFNALAGLGGPIAMVARAAGMPGPEARLTLTISFVGLAAAAVIPAIVPALVVFGGTSVVAAHAIWWRLTGRLAGTTTGWREVMGAGGVAAVALGLSGVIERLFFGGVPGTAGGLLLYGAVVIGVPSAVALGFAWTSGLVTPGERHFWRTLPMGSRRVDMLTTADGPGDQASGAPPPAQP